MNHNPTPHGGDRQAREERLAFFRQCKAEDAHQGGQKQTYWDEKIEETLKDG